MEDEEDLEALRLAALQSLKRTSAQSDSNSPQLNSQQCSDQQPQFWPYDKPFRYKKPKPFGTQFSARGNRNVSLPIYCFK